jgi:hypothetical protein
MVNITYQSILTEIEKYNELDVITIKNIIKELETTLVLIPRQSMKYAEISKLIYYIKTEAEADIKDHIENRIDIDFIKLPIILKEKIKIHIINISKKELLEKKIDDNDMYEGHICQHTISWNNIIRLRKTNPNKFNQELFSFIKKYVIENKDKDFVCKSCYQLIDLRKYTNETFSNSDTIIISNSLETELETIREYEKYSKSIKNMDKIIEDFEQITVDNELLQDIRYMDYYNAHRFGNWIFDARLSYQFNEKHKLAIISSNVFNRIYSLRPLKIEPPRTIMLQYTLKF